MIKLTFLFAFGLVAFGIVLLTSLVVAFRRRRPRAGLIDNPEQYIGSELFVEPFYGYGWGDSDQHYIDVPGPFAFVLENLFTRNGRVVGGIGKITTENHLFSGHWLSFSMRHRGLASLAEKDAAYSVSISPHPFSIVEGDFPKVLQQGGKRFLGWGFIHQDANVSAGEGEVLS